MAMLKKRMKHELPKLPYGFNALEPWIDAKTMEIHHGKHHQAYVDKLNMALEKHPELFEWDIEELLKDLNGVPEDIRFAVKNNGGGHYNHSLFWKWMTPDEGDKKISGKTAAAIKKSFGSFDKFKEEFTNAAMSRFGSGWAWLVSDNRGVLSITSTANQDCPITDGLRPILGLDLWEHSYYLKWQSNRKGYVDNWWNVVNWKRVEELYKMALN